MDEHEWIELLQLRRMGSVYYFTLAATCSVCLGHYLRQLLREFVVQGRDHAVKEMFIVCPFMYWRVVRATFGDQQVYRSVTMSPVQTQQYLLQQSKQGWPKPYSWGRSSSSSSSLPIAYILLKQKEDFPSCKTDYQL